MELTFNNEKNFACIKLSGSLEQDVILNAFDSAVSDREYKKGMGRVWDFREADLSSISPDVIREMAQYSLKFPAGINDVKVAFVTNRDLEYGFSRMFEMSSYAETPIRVFRCMNQAEEWISGQSD
ncbi:MAG: hypothetical protein HKP41_11020 [Desulfobacterales bacterium]|nr:hypothetical protein [Deltaproteobacteria bacterium]MBT8360620.1 hypothetical protein [Deltaproteobacteria bacterium]NNK94870.1 hypothetical protein [Desulfobacterales bacterium]